MRSSVRSRHPPPEHYDQIVVSEQRMKIDALIEAARNFKPTEEDFKRLAETVKAVDEECAKKEWKPGEYAAWLNKPFSSL